MKGERTMATAEQIHAAIAAAKGRVFTLVASTLPTSEKTLAKRAADAEKKSVEGITFRAQKTLSTEEVDGGTISVVRVSGRPDFAWGGGDPIRLSKKGTQTLGFVGPQRTDHHRLVEDAVQHVEGAHLARSRHPGRKAALGAVGQGPQAAVAQRLELLLQVPVQGP